jgi:hypothetical protein
MGYGFILSLCCMLPGPVHSTPTYKKRTVTWLSNFFLFCSVNFFELNNNAMLEIIALIFLTRKIGDLAERKGLKKGWWKFYTVIGWFGGEIIGIVLSILLFQTEDTFALLPLGYAFAIGSYLILRAILSRKPDIETPAFEFEGQNQQH